jgi:hypothetical protein
MRTQPRQPTQAECEYIRSSFTYDPETGCIVWARTCGKATAGSEAGNLRGYGRKPYRIVGACGRDFLAHRIAWFLHFGTWPSHHIDHVNGDASDNRIANLRPATPSQNGWNRGPQVNNTSGYKGVTRFTRMKTPKWKAEIEVNGKRKHLGLFETAEEASNAYEAAAMEAHGEFHRRAEG